MSKTSQVPKQKSAATKTRTRAEVGPAMWGRDIFVEALERENVEVIFAYPGGASMEIHQSLTKSKIRTILPRFEWLLKNPDVHLGMDPEFNLIKSGRKPGTKIGTPQPVFPRYVEDETRAAE